MAKVWIAQFEYGNPKLAKADLIKETEKSVMIENSQDVFENFYYIPNRLAKDSHHIFHTPGQALAFLNMKCQDHIEKLQKAITTTQEWQVKLTELTEKVNQPVEA